MELLTFLTEYKDQALNENKRILIFNNHANYIYSLIFLHDIEFKSMFHNHSSLGQLSGYTQHPFSSLITCQLGQEQPG